MPHPADAAAEHVRAQRASPKKNRARLNFSRTARTNQGYDDKELSLAQFFDISPG